MIYWGAQLGKTCTQFKIRLPWISDPFTGGQRHEKIHKIYVIGIACEKKNYHFMPLVASFMGETIQKYDMQTGATDLLPIGPLNCLPHFFP